MTQILQAQKHTAKETEKILHPLVKEWFFNKFKDFSLTQEYGVLNREIETFIYLHII